MTATSDKNSENVTLKSTSLLKLKRTIDILAGTMTVHSNEEWLQNNDEYKCDNYKTDLYGPGLWESKSEYKKRGGMDERAYEVEKNKKAK